MRKGLTALVFALLVSACGGTGTNTTDPSPAPTVAPETTSAAADGATGQAPSSSAEPTEAPSEATALDESPSFDGPPAPDFELALADGSVFALSDEAKPVYMVFWAEW